jgi:hypothetical protein
VWNVSTLAISGMVLVCVSGGALLGMLLRVTLPAHHLSQDSQDVVKLGVGLIATMAALVLGLLIASPKGSFDTVNTELKQGGPTSSCSTGSWPGTDRRRRTSAS